jgi:hypothetical protein
MFLLLSTPPPWTSELHNEELQYEAAVHEWTPVATFVSNYISLQLKQTFVYHVLHSCVLELACSIFEVSLRFTIYR